METPGVMIRPSNFVQHCVCRPYNDLRLIDILYIHIYIRGIYIRIYIRHKHRHSVVFSF